MKALCGMSSTNEIVFLKGEISRKNISLHSTDGEIYDSTKSSFSDVTVSGATNQPEGPRTENIIGSQARYSDEPLGKLASTMIRTGAKTKEWLFYSELVKL